MGNAVITLRDLMPVAHPEKTKIKFNMNAGDVNVRAYDMLLKDTSLITVIGGKEMVYAAQAIYGRTYEQMFPLIGIACIYLLLVMVFSWLQSLLERRLRQSDRR